MEMEMERRAGSSHDSGKVDSLGRDAMVLWRQSIYGVSVCVDMRRYMTEMGFYK